MREIVGASLIELTVTEKDWVAVSEPSVAWSWTTARPDWFAAGVIIRVRARSVRPKRTLASGTTAGFEDVMRKPTSRSTFPLIENGTGGVGVSSLVTRSGMRESSNCAPGAKPANRDRVVASSGQLAAGGTWK